jgi:hypothetical protein
MEGHLQAAVAIGGYADFIARFGKTTGDYRYYSRFIFY